MHGHTNIKLLHLIGCLHLSTSDARSHKYQVVASYWLLTSLFYWCTVTQISSCCILLVAYILVLVMHGNTNIYSIFECFSKIYLQNLIFDWNITRIKSTLHKDQFTFMIISFLIVLRIRNVSKKFEEKMKTHVLCSKKNFLPENRGVYEIRWKITPDPDRSRWQSKMAVVLCMLYY
jgi:hypothetical protein